uniref:Uncharacterized protein n=1 Tax=Panagrolaimus davidi TaxID=227884 RepID=A0A914QF88_9BILA
MDSQRNGITNQPGDQGYRKRPSELSIPSVVAPKTETTQRLSYIDIPTQPLTPTVTTIPYPPQPHQPHQQHQQQPEHSLMLINGGYSFLERKRTISNTAATEAVTTSNYELPDQHFRTNETEYPSEMNDRIQVQDLESPYGNPNKKNSKNSKTQPIQPNEVPPIPPKILNQSSRSQNSESSSSIFKNTIYNRNLEQQHYVPNSPFIPIAFNPLTTEERPNMDSVQESEVSSIDSSFDEQPTSNWNTEANVKCESQNEAHYTTLNHDMTHEKKFESNIYQPKSNWNTEANTKHESHLETNAIETHYSNIKNPELPLQQNFGSYAQQQSSSTWIKKTNVVSTTNENYPNAIKNQSRILTTNPTINPNQDLYANLTPELPPRQRHGISSHSNDEMEQQLNTATESAIKGQKNEDSISFTSTESNSDIVAFWSHHPSTRRRRTSNDLLNKKGFLTDESSEDGEVVRVPKVITSNKPPLKNYGLTQILQLEKGKLESDVQQPSLLSMVYGKSNEIDKQQTKEIRSDSLIIALESIKVMEEDNENGNISKYQTMEITTESYSRTNNVQQERYGTNYQTTEITTHSNYENIPYKSNPEEIKSFSNDIALKRESMSFKPDEIHKTESTEIFVTPKTNFRRTFEVKKEATMTPETPIIPSTSNFFDTWGKAADRNYLDQTKTTVPFNLRKTKLEETEKNIVANVREESDSDSTMTFSSLSSDEEDSESDIDKRMIKLKQKIQAHLPQNINQEKKHAENKAEAGSSRSAVTNVEEFSSVQEEAPQPFQFKRLPLIGSAINTPPQSAEIFSTPPTSPIFQIPSTNSPQQPPFLPKMPPPSLP